MPIIDAHVHIFPDAVAAKAVARLAEHSGIVFGSDGTLGSLRCSMTAAGIGACVSMPVSTRPEQVAGINRYSLSLLAEPGVIPFGTVFPGSRWCRDEIRMLREAGIRGVKFHCDYQGFFVDDEAVFPVYESVREAGLIACFHAGGNVNFNTPPRCTPRRLARMLDRMPGLKVIAAHLGGWRMWDEVEQHLVGRDLWLDTCFCAGQMPDSQLLRIARAHGIGRVMFGTDSPWIAEGQALADISRLPWTAEERRALLGENALALFGPPPAEFLGV